MESIRDKKARIQVDLSLRAVKMQRKSKKNKSKTKKTTWGRIDISVVSFASTTGRNPLGTGNMHPRSDWTLVETIRQKICRHKRYAFRVRGNQNFEPRAPFGFHIFDNHEKSSSLLLMSTGSLYQTPFYICPSTYNVPKYYLYLFDVAILRCYCRDFMPFCWLSCWIQEYWSELSPPSTYRIVWKWTSSGLSKRLHKYGSYVLQLEKIQEFGNGFDEMQSWRIQKRRTVL